MDYGTGKKVEAEMTVTVSVDAWKRCQTSLNELGLAKPPLEIDGDPGPLTLAAAQGLVPLIEKQMKAKKK